MSIEQQLAAITARITAAQRAQVRAEAERDAAQAAAAKAKEELQRDFGVGTAEEANDLLIIMRAELAEIVARLTTSLDAAGV